MKVKDRLKAPTPKFFKILRNIGLALGSVAAVVATAPVSLPSAIVSFAGYLAVAGGVISAISQATVIIEPDGERILIQDTNTQLPLDAAIGVGLRNKGNTTVSQVISKAIQKTRGKVL